MKPVRLHPRFVERVWGTTDLGPWFPNSTVKIGEVWFTADENETSEGVPLRELMEREGEALLGTAVQPAYGGRFPILAEDCRQSGFEGRNQGWPSRRRNPVTDESQVRNLGANAAGTLPDE